MQGWYIRKYTRTRVITSPTPIYCLLLCRIFHTIATTVPLALWFIYMFIVMHGCVQTFLSGMNKPFSQLTSTQIHSLGKILFHKILSVFQRLLCCTKHLLPIFIWKCIPECDGWGIGMMFPYWSDTKGISMIGTFGCELNSLTRTCAKSEPELSSFIWHTSGYQINSFIGTGWLCR